MAAKKQDDDRSLKRLGGGRWQTHDERFTIEPQSGTWVLVDAEQTDDLGLPLVRGPFRSLTDAKAAVEAAREAVAPESPLASRVKEAKAQPSKAAATAAKADTGTAAPKVAAGRRAAKERPPEAEPPPEPRWMNELSPRDRGRARRLIERLTEAGVRDAEGVVRQDLSGGVPTVTRIAVADRLAEVLPTSGDAAAAVARALGPVVEALDDGRDDGLEVRWRLVDGDNRPIGLTAQDLKDATKRRAAAEKEKGR